MVGVTKACNDIKGNRRRRQRSPRSAPQGADLISELSDDILISVLSKLSLKDAVRTSELSTRWKDLWRFTRKLNFERDKQNRLPKFICWISGVLEGHEGTDIDELALCFKLYGKNYTCEIDSWISFALKKKVRKLVLNLEAAGQLSYALTTQLLCQHNLDTLTIIQLTDVKVRSEVVQCLLAFCPFLEVLSVKSSNYLHNLRVAGPSLKLKCLKIINCKCLAYVELSDINLVSFGYSGHQIRISVENTPRLVDASFGGEYARFFLDKMRFFSCHIPRLEKLRLRTSSQIASLSRFPQLSNLRELKLRLDDYSIDYVLLSTSLLKASPFLQVFRVKVSKPSSSKCQPWPWQEILSPKQCKVKKAQEVLCKVKKQQVQCKVEIKKSDANWNKFLKLIELSGYVGYIDSIDLLCCLLKRSHSLEKLVIPAQGWSPDQLETNNIAKKLYRSLPAGAQLLMV